MPELPDVEGWRRFFEGRARGATVRRVTADSTILRNTTPQELGRALRGRRFDSPGRHGKWLMCHTDGPSLLLHFGMTGELAWNEERHPHDRVTLQLDRGRLAYRNMRKLGGAWLAHDDDEIDVITGPLGPDAFELPKSSFIELLGRRRGGLKAALMDQRFVAGLGNLTVDESLWRARLSPRRDVRSLDHDERAALHRAVQRVLRASVKVGHVPGRATWLTGARRDADPACPRCSTPLSRARVAGRTTYWCPRCQPTS